MRLNPPQSLKARVAMLADDQMISAKFRKARGAHSPDQKAAAQRQSNLIGGGCHESHHRRSVANWSYSGRLDG